jgi:hypothetical protein
LAAKLAQGADLIAAQRMNGRLAVLGPPHMQCRRSAELDGSSRVAKARARAELVASEPADSFPRTHVIQLRETPAFR